MHVGRLIGMHMLACKPQLIADTCRQCPEMGFSSTHLVIWIGSFRVWVILPSSNLIVGYVQVLIGCIVLGDDCFEIGNKLGVSLLIESYAGVSCSEEKQHFWSSRLYIELRELDSLGGWHHQIHHSHSIRIIPEYSIECHNDFVEDPHGYAGDGSLIVGG